MEGIPIMKRWQDKLNNRTQRGKIHPNNNPPKSPKIESSRLDVKLRVHWRRTRVWRRPPPSAAQSKDEPACRWTWFRTGPLAKETTRSHPSGSRTTSQARTRRSALRRRTTRKARLTGSSIQVNKSKCSSVVSGCLSFFWRTRSIQTRRCPKSRIFRSSRRRNRRRVIGRKRASSSTIWRITRLASSFAAAFRSLWWSCWRHLSLQYVLRRLNDFFLWKFSHQL